jgi:hypothetical protein
MFALMKGVHPVAMAGKATTPLLFGLFAFLGKSNHTLSYAVLVAIGFGLMTLGS